MHTNTRILTLFAGAIVLLLAPKPMLASPECNPWGPDSEGKFTWGMLSAVDVIVPDIALAWTEDGRFGATVSFPLVFNAVTFCVGSELDPWLRTSLYAIGSVQLEHVNGEPWEMRFLGGGQLMLAPDPEEVGLGGFGELGTAAGHRSGLWWGAGLGLGGPLGMIAVGYRQYGVMDDVLHEARLDLQIPIPTAFYL